MASKGKKNKQSSEVDNLEHMRANDNLKVGLFKKIITLLEESQRTARSHPRILKELKKLYYRQTDPKLAKDYQKYFFSLIWNAMIIPFREAKCPAQERMVKVFTTFALSTGTLTDIEEYDFPLRDLPPFYTYVVRIFRSNHADVKPLVRLRLTELMYEILKEKHMESFFVLEKIKSNLCSNLLDRSKDKNPAVRTTAFRCFPFIEVDPEQELLKRLKFHADFDPHAEVRKSALISLVTIAQPRVSFIVRKAFDLNDNIRTEAFKALVKIPFSRLKTDQRFKIIQWGLMQPVGVIKKIVTKELLPAWIADESCGNSVINLLCKLDIASNASTAALLFRALYPDDSEETFERMDLSFLDNNKLVPINVISVEKVIYWRYMCGKFKHRPYCVQKIIPEAGHIIGYIEELIDGIHKECLQATKENLEEEEIEHILCLSHILRIAELCNYEEGSRRTMETLLGKILRDPMLDEAVVIYTAVDVAHKVVEKPHFNNFMIEILQGIFEIDEYSIDQEMDGAGDEDGTVITDLSFNLNRTRLSSLPSPSAPNVVAVPVAQCTNVYSRDNENDSSISSMDMSSQSSLSGDISIKDNPKAGSHVQVSGDVSVAENPDAGSHVQVSGDVSVAENPGKGSQVSVSSDISKSDKQLQGSQSTISDGCADSEKENLPVSPALVPKLVTKTKLKGDEIVKLKNERATLIAQRHRLMMKKEAAIKLCDFEGAQSIHNEMEAIKDQENMIKNQIEDCERHEAYIRAKVVKSPEVGRNDNNSELVSPILHPSLLKARKSLLRPPEVEPVHPLSCASISRTRLSFADAALEKEDCGVIDELQGTLSKTVVSLANSLRGVVILTRYLTWQNELNLYVRTMYDNHILACLEDKDYRLRMYAMYLICIVGMIEKSEAKKSMAVMIQGLTPHEDESVETASFKGMVDLLLQYNYAVFLATEDDDDYARELPYPLNTPGLSTKQMEEFFVTKLLSYSFEEENQVEPRISQLSVKVLGFLKLLLRDRIRDEGVIAWLLCLWAELKYTGTPICLNIGYWVPVYATMGIPQALGIGKAFVKSVKIILSKETEMKEEGCEYDLIKLAHLVISNINNSTQQPVEKLPTVHEEVALILLDEISGNINHPHGIIFTKLLRMLEVETQAVAIQIQKKISDILEMTNDFPEAISKRLQISLRCLQGQLTKRFGSGPPNEDNMEIDSDKTDDKSNANIANLNEAIGHLNLDQGNGAPPRQASMIFQQGSEIMEAGKIGRSLSLPGTRVTRSISNRSLSKSMNTAIARQESDPAESEGDSVS